MPKRKPAVSDPLADILDAIADPTTSMAQGRILCAVVLPYCSDAEFERVKAAAPCLHSLVL